MARLSLMVGVTAVLAAWMPLVAADHPDCDGLYGGVWKGGEAKAELGGEEYEWVFNPCYTTEASYKCNQPPYSGDIWVAQYNNRNPNPCLHQLFCEASPHSVYNSNGNVVYNFPKCIPSQTGIGPSPRSVTVTVSCDSPTFKIDTVNATKVGPGYHFTMHVHAPCYHYTPQPPPVAPVAPAPCHTAFAETATDFFTVPLNTSGVVHGQVFDWGFNLCHQVEYNGNTGYFLNMNAKTRHITNLNLLDMATQTANGYKFSFSSSYNVETAVVEVLTDGGECKYLSPPEQGVVGTVNEKGGVQYTLIVKCMSN